MASLRHFAQCIGLGDDFSVLRDFFGYQAAPAELSVRTQMERLRGKHFHLNIIRVGVEAFIPDVDEPFLDSAVRFARDVYAQIDVGIGRVEHFAIPIADAHGHEVISDECELGELTDEWTVHNDGVDVFAVLIYTEAAGLSASPGPCDKDCHGGGLMIEVNVPPIPVFAKVLAHELAHYFCGFDDISDPNDPSLMSNGPGIAITDSQADGIRANCFMKGGC